MPIAKVHAVHLYGSFVGVFLLFYTVARLLTVLCLLLLFGKFLPKHRDHVKSVDPHT